ncbi:tetracycline resistance protein, class A-like [Topomyia yanbarensis]|uniref:tetracycline resistance protein, class A-like n=1 Tax=Topomyia yanbarensis TaxID=2498891 RepID=UPI00273C4104|nr:tetracycline resistance protein, class A-like [Topomyia yanbarensis]
MEDITEENSLIQNEPTNSTETSVPFQNRYLLLEPPVFLLSYAYYVSSAVLTDQIVYQTCTVSFGVNRSECAQLGKEHESAEVLALEARVQPYTANILMVDSIVNSIVPAVLNLFIGPWSDRFGRKPVLLATFAGCVISYLLDTVICFLSSRYPVSPWYYALSCVPLALTGSICTMMTTVYCYIADVTSEQDRSKKMSILEAAQYIGMLLGNISSSFILRSTNATTVFAIAAGTVFLAFLYIVIGVQESISINDDHQKESYSFKISYLFRPGLVLDTFRTAFGRRPNFNRPIILMGVIALGANLFVEQYQTVFFLFVRKHFNWSVRKYSFYNSADTVFLMFGNLVGTYGLQKKLGLTEAGITAIGFFTSFLGSVAVAVASESWHLYAAMAFCMLKGVTDPMTRAFISNAAPAEDIGKIFAFSSTFEELMPLGGAPLYTLVYKRTLSWNPGAFNWISALVYIFCYSLTMAVCILQSMQRSS